MTYDYIIVGAGIVGLATALKLLEYNPKFKIGIVEKEGKVAAHQTSHNSGVIHSGIYYEPNSAKAINCKKGYDMLLAFCKQHDVPYDLCGKVIVAVNEKELPILEDIYKKGIKNGLKNLCFLNHEEIKEKEPHVEGIKAIWVPQAGIINYERLANKYAEIIQSKGGDIFLNERIKSINKDANEIVIASTNQEWKTKNLINCAGLYADKVAQHTVDASDCQIVPFRGEYFKLIKEKEYLVNGLIYPVPDINFPFLGVHFTKMIEGGIEAGPNAVLAFKREGYALSQIDAKELIEIIRYAGFRKLATKHWKKGMLEMKRSFSKRAFVKALQTLIPEITVDDVIRNRAGVRAQGLDRSGNLVKDFLFLEQANVLNVCNAPSPAATSSLAIGETVANKILSQHI